ncbi:MYPU_1760 family metalloprotease [Mycoplasma crocodyli]|uniref:EF-hand domain-containing protein n=1 Tax=Mycoplasma crocodyli (strain ATCC 51981 / MP145) TaxID=512564 RepID=D5E4S0_MYCCM|nr:hypothetical protein [Mycoplasma crocodyli]ADE19464.1 hypothetical protein MCRO_0085 [Mycoplasma crocodyli MP145]
MKKSNKGLIIGLLLSGGLILAGAVGAFVYIWPTIQREFFNAGKKGNEPSGSGNILGGDKNSIIHKDDMDEKSIDLNKISFVNYPKNPTMTDDEYKNYIDNMNIYFKEETQKITEHEDTEAGYKNVFYRQYVDPITHVAIRDYAYHFNEDTNEKRYFLGDNGLIALAIEFRKKVTFGPEVEMLKAININDFRIITSESKGLYIPLNRSIYINTIWGIEKGIDIFSKTQLILPTLFHEYMHHWATCYAEVGDNRVSEDRSFNIFKQQVKDPLVFKENIVHINEDNILNKVPFTTKIAYYGNSNSLNLGYWNSSFVNNFYKTLNYDIPVKYNDIPTANNYVKNSFKPDFAFRKFSINDLWNYSNADRSLMTIGEYDKLTRRFVNEGDIKFTSYSSFGSSQKGYTPEQVKYYYSMTELVPREWSKFTFDSEFDNTKVVKFKGSNYNKNKWALSWSGLYIKTNDQILFYPSSVADDWAKVYLMDISTVNSDSVGPYNASSRDLVYPNTTDSLTYSAWETIQNNSDTNKIRKENRDIAFYENFLNAMGYGKTISQIMYKNGTKWINYKNGEIETSQDSFSKIKLMGYLPNNSQYKGFVFANKNGKNELVKFSINPFNDFFKGSKSKYEAEVTNNMAYKSYITQTYIDFNTLDLETPIKYWIDKNGDGNLDENEIENGEITLPTSRYVSTLASYNYNNRDNKNFKWYSLSKDKENNVKILFKKLPR